MSEGLRVQIVDEDRLVGHYARCRAVYFAPFNEDSGFVTLEAFRSGKAVLPARDSGGPAELVEHGRSGFCGAPEPRELPAALDRLAAEPGLAAQLGAAAEVEARRHTWADAVAELLR